MARHAHRLELRAEGRILRRISGKHAHHLRESGLAHRVRPHGRTAYLELNRSARQLSRLLAATTITVTEMLANAGVPAPRRDSFLSSEREFEVREKIRVWPQIGDDRAVRVGPRIEEDLYGGQSPTGGQSQDSQNETQKNPETLAQPAPVETAEGVI